MVKKERTELITRDLTNSSSPVITEQTEPELTPHQKPQIRNWLSGSRGLFVGLGLGALLAVGGMTAIARSQTSNSNQPVTANNRNAAQSVTAATASLAAVNRTLEATGSVVALDPLPILPQATGLQIQQVLVDEGQTVQAGQVLAILDPSVLEAQLQQAQSQLVSAQAIVGQREAALAQQRATLAEAESNLNRYQQLAASGAISRQELEARSTAAATARAGVGVAEAAVNSAQADVQANNAQIERLQTQVAQTQVRAPAGGIISERIARVGDVTAPTNKLFTIIRNGALEVQARIPENQLSQVRVGSTAHVTSATDQRIDVAGKVRDISPVVDPQTRQATVKIALPLNSFLRSGMFVRAAITTGNVQALSVPAKAVLPQTDGSSIVYVLQPDDTVRAQTVTLGVRTNNNDPNARVEITSGLKAGDRIVVNGAGYLKDGEKVKVV